MIRGKYKNRLLKAGLILAFGSFQCAKQGFPPGGPVDKIPPTILEVFPPPDSTGLKLDTQVEMLFSERMDRKSVEESIFISPNPKGELNSHWRGKRLRIELPQKLKANKTYVITIGTDAKDLRHNRMQKSFTLAFSTGQLLDQGEISGRVYGDGEGAMLWAYSLEDNPTPDPAKEKADYITQCDAQGDYTLTHLSKGRYRLFAVLDRDGNREYDPEYDALGIATSDAEIAEGSSTVMDRNFKIAIRDTTSPGLSTAVTIDQFHVDLHFDESLSEKNVGSKDSYLIVTTDDTLTISEAYPGFRDLSKIHLVTQKQIPGLEYRIFIQNLFDLWGNEIDTIYNTTSFFGSTRPDTIRPQLISQSPEDSATGIPLDERIELVFSEAMNQKLHFWVTDSSGQEVSGQFVWKSSAQVQFIPSGKYKSLMTYQVVIDSAFDRFGNPLADSSLSFVFTTLNTDTLSSISGTLIDKAQGAEGKIFLKAAQAQRGGKSYQISLDTPGEYIFQDVLPGIYLIEGFRDTNGDSTYSYGQAVPYLPAERFVVYPDSIKVRSRWPNEGNDIIFR